MRSILSWYFKYKNIQVRKPNTIYLIIIIKHKDKRFITCIYNQQWFFLIIQSALFKLSLVYKPKYPYEIKHILWSPFGDILKMVRQSEHCALIIYLFWYQVNKDISNHHSISTQPWGLKIIIIGCWGFRSVKCFITWWYWYATWKFP